MNTADSLSAVLALAKKNDWPPDLILATGDLSQDESEDSYRYFLKIFSALKVPVFCLPGNHDVPERMSDVLSTEFVQTTRHIVSGNWQILLLDSTISNQNGGSLKKSQLAFLMECLYENDNLYTFVCLHHNVLPTKTTWLDTMTLKNSADFFQITDQFPNVKGILTGHIHQEFAQERRGVPIISSPSTCIQFLPGSPKFSLDQSAPGYRWLELNEDGSIKTGVKRLSEFAFTPDLSSKGY